MRIIGGAHKGKGIQQPDIELARPMSDRAREAAFNVLGDIKDLQVLDLYSGSGALALESLSRGCVRAIAVDASIQAVDVIKQNAAELGVIDSMQIVHAPVGRWLMQVDMSFDLVFADPPFDNFDVSEFGLIGEKIMGGGTFVLKHHRRVDPPELDQLELKINRRYGSTEVSFYKK